MSAPPTLVTRIFVFLKILRALLSARFECLRSRTVEPGGNRGILRLVNSRKLTALLSWIFSKERVIRMKERLGFGQTIVVLARKRG